MGILVSCQSISKSYSSRALFREISFGIEDDQKIGLIGPNGSGKSTMLNILAGSVAPDQGSVVSRREIRIAYVAQEESFPDNQPVDDIVRRAAFEVPFEEHERAASIDSTLARLGFPDKHACAAALSGGWRKRLAIACGLVKQPHLLLLDEPTNHLDLEGVLWLENFLKSAALSFVLVSHDRAFLQAVTNRMIELNPAYPQGFLSVKGNYSEFLIAREEQLSAQQTLQQSLASKVRREIAWLERGARARQTKARGRIQEAVKLIDELAEVKQRNSSNAAIEIDFDASGRKTKELVAAKNISKTLGGRLLFSHLGLVLTPGAKLGLVGRNGSGKTTLLKTIIGKIEPDSGTVIRAGELKIVWFDQNREQLDKTKTLKEALCSSGDSVVYRGRSLHVTTWAKRFLFRPDQLNMPISYLSGGEQARILIADLMLKSADLLILDEPTNDLDIPSLEVLEESLEEFPGAVVLVSHDRMMLDAVSKQILVLDGKGGAQFFSDYEQFEISIERLFAPVEKKTENTQKKSKIATKSRAALSTGEKRELTAMPDKIEAAEKELAAMQAEMERTEIASDYARLHEMMSKVHLAQKELERLFTRWQELEGKALADNEIA